MTIKRSDQMTVVKILKALSEDWDLVDYGDDLNFLVLVSEGREELDFYPKKELVKQMEQAGLIENLDPKGSAVREPETHWESDPTTEGWKEVTEEGIIVFSYRVTTQGTSFLRDAAERAQGSLPPLRITNQPVETQQRVLKVVTYDKQAIEKLIKAFDQQARTLVEEAFSNTDLDQQSLANASPFWGPKLVQSVGLQPVDGVVARGRLVRHTTNMTGETVTRELPEISLSGQELRLFLKALVDKFPLTNRVIRKADPAEAATYPFNASHTNDTSPLLLDRVVILVVETEKARLVVAVKNAPEPAMNPLQSLAKLEWIELLEN